MKLITKIYISIGFILLTFLLVTVMYQRQSDLVEKEIRDVLFTTEKLKMAESMQKNVFNLEAGLRGYLLSDIDDFLDRYYSGVQLFDTIHYQLVILEKNPEQRSRLLTIDSLKASFVTTFAEPLITSKLQSTNSEKDLRKYTYLANKLVKTGRGKERVSKIADLYQEYSIHENRQMQIQLAQLRDRTRFTDFLSSWLTGLAIIIGILTAFFLGRIIRKRLKQMIFMADHVAEGKFGDRIYDTAKDEMSQLSRSLNIMASRLDTSFTNLNKMNRELDQFAYVVSHDLKAPLRAINNLAEWIEEDLPHADPEIKDKLTLMRGRVVRMENLINGILAYSKIGRIPVPAKTFNVKQLLSEIIDSLAPPANVTITLPEQTPTITTEKILLEQVFTNLISNALKYNHKPDATISITFQDLGASYQFAVSDNGPGIPEKFHKKIFGVFQTILSRDTRESTGVGLSIVQKIITEKNGNVWVESAPDQGATFYFTWPKE